MTTDTPRTDAQSWTEYDYCGNMHETKAAVSRHHAEQLERELLAARQDAFNLANALSKAESEVERLRELLKRAINEIEKTPLHSPRLTAFTAHRLAERYREEMTNTSTKPVEPQEDDK